MIGRIVEIAEDGRYACLSRGFLVIRQSGGTRQEHGRVPIDDIAAVIGNAHGLSYSNNIMVALAERGIPFVLCSDNHNVAGVLWAIDGNFQQAKRMDAQLASSRPLRKRLWAQVVRCKLEQQAETLKLFGLPPAPLTTLAAKVRSGDPENLEAQGARRYWTLLFGKDFRRDANAEGVNALLNYGYTVLRASVARSVIASGLHPTLGIFHQNENNAMRLVDDLMEPFRPLIDRQVKQMNQAGITSVTSEAKRQLAHVMFQDLATLQGRTPVMSCVHRLTVSLALVYLGERDALDLPTARIGRGKKIEPAHEESNEC